MHVRSTAAEDVELADDCPKSVLGKAQLILDAFGSGSYRMRLTELSRRSGVPKASTYRLAQELVRWGLLDRSGDSYQLGIRMFELGQRVPATDLLQRTARPWLADLSASTRAMIHLAVLDGLHVLYLEKLAGEAFVRPPSRVGGRLPASCTASGRVLLAATPHREEALRRLSTMRLPRPTPRAITSVSELRRQLDAVAERGFAVEIEELLPGHGSVAVPVTGADGTTYAAVTATVPVRRLDIDSLVGALREAAGSIGRAVSHRILLSGHVGLLGDSPAAG